jgi:hypothetical protein
MRILRVDEIPEEWKKQLDATGLGRYDLFFEELNQTSLVSAASAK